MMGGKGASDNKHTIKKSKSWDSFLVTNDEKNGEPINWHNQLHLGNFIKTAGAGLPWLRALHQVEVGGSQ